MRRLGALLLGLCGLRAEKADLIILVETSQLTCGSPITAAKKALAQFCAQEGTVLVGTFYRGASGKVIRWITPVPIRLKDSESCIGIAPKVSSRCDSVYDVHLLSALEEALARKGANHIVILASGLATDKGTSVGDICRMAERQGVQLYVASLGWLGSDQKAQRLLKDLVGYFDGREENYRIYDPRSEETSDRLALFLKEVLQKAAGENPAPPAGVRPAEDPQVDRVKRESSQGVPLWAWVVGAALIAALITALIISVAGKSSSKQAQAPIIIQQPASPSATEVAPPRPTAPPAPVLRRLIIYYPHTQQDVPLSPTTAPITLGRAPDNTIVIQDGTVSSRHARLFLQGNQWYVQDLGSTNGTFVNEQRVSQHPVRIGDKLRLGAIVIQIAG